MLNQSTDNPTPEAVGELVERGAADALTALNWLGGQQSCEVVYHRPIYGDDDDQTTEWRTYRVSGPINDREWDVIGRGDTPLAAILSARAALERPHSKEQG